MRIPTLLAASVLAVGFTAPALNAAPLPPAEKGKPVDVVLCLDTSNSMDGLIDSAKRKLWAVVNDLARIDPAPTLRVGLYSYGNNNYDPAKGWVRKDLDLTTDLDEVYRHLFALTTKGGTEYVGRVSRDALADLKWADDAGALRLMFVCGNEPATQDQEVSVESVAGQAKAKGVTINSIYCGPASHRDAAGWQEFAKLCGGKYANIDQSRAGTQAVIKTPYDEKIQQLGVKLNDTYCWYGPRGKDAEKNQLAQDSNAAKTADAVATERSVTKAGKLYKLAEADLIDRLETDKTFDLAKVLEADLPDELKKLKPEEREAYLKKKAADRADLQKQIADLNTQRQKFLEEERKKQPVSEADKAFDDALRTMLREQAEARGLKLQP